jgi:hypothetical protein
MHTEFVAVPFGSGTFQTGLSGAEPSNVSLTMPAVTVTVPDEAEDGAARAVAITAAANPRTAYRRNPRDIALPTHASIACCVAREQPRLLHESRRD